MRRISPGAFRLFLAMVVVLHHNTPLRLGGWAVGLFFCLSGFWIAEMWGRKYQKLDRPYLEFLISRWWRLAPVLFVTTLLAVAVMHTSIVPGDLRVTHLPLWWLTQPLIVGSVSMGRLLPPTWSLDVEMQFYAIAPLLIILAVRWPRAMGFVAAIALGWCWIVQLQPMVIEVARVDVWVGVFLLGVLTSTRRWRPSDRVAAMSAGITLLLFAIVAVDPTTRSWILMRGATGHRLTGWLAATLTVLTIVTAVPLAMATTAVPSGWFDRFLGDLSYPLYLFHWLPHNWFYAHLPAHPRPPMALLLLAINIGASLVGAVIIQLVIDRPIQELRARWVRKHAVGRNRQGEAMSEGSPAQAFAGST